MKRERGRERKNIIQKKMQTGAHPLLQSCEPSEHSHKKLDKTETASSVWANKILFKKQLVWKINRLYFGHAPSIFIFMVLVCQMHAVAAELLVHSNSFKRIHSLLASVGWDNNGLVYLCFEENKKKLSHSKWEREKNP